MTLFLATLLSGFALILFGAHFLWHGMRSAVAVKAFPRSRLAAYILFGTAAAWFLYHITQLGPADFGQYKKILFVIFALVAVGAFYFVPDFLAVRGFAGLLLLTAHPILFSAYMQDVPTRLFLVGFVYLVIIFAIIIGASPYHLRNWIDWLYAKASRPRTFGALNLLYGLLLIGVALLTY